MPLPGFVELYLDLFLPAISFVTLHPDYAELAFRSIPLDDAFVIAQIVSLLLLVVSVSLLVVSVSLLIAFVKQITLSVR